MALRLTGQTSGYVELEAPAVAGDNTLTLPTSNGSAHQLLKNGATAGQLEYGLTLPSGNGTSGQYLQTAGDGTTSWSTSGLPAQVLTLGTSVASTSGTAIDFASIPSTVKRITVMFNGVSTDGTTYYRVQLGSGSPQTSGYSCRTTVGTTGWNAVTTSTGGFDFNWGGSSVVTDGHLVLTNISSNIWVASGLFTSSFPSIVWTGGNVTLSGTLDRVRITTANGTDNFDAGTINIMYEG